ncbi:exocyst complex component Sec5-domain-containing protein [Geopyxis carbonaria]|nr:exocyst complex component Sec5-domain-containing protein [Geopyxis carbonaria]
MNDLRSEAALLKHYRLHEPFPESWSDPIEDAQAKQRMQFRKSTSRYSVLQEDGISSSLKGLVGGDLYSGGAVPEDEPDPLGSTDSVARVLRKRGLPVDDNVRLRNRYMVSSKHFSPTAFLRDVHANTPSPVLQQGLSYLSQSIAQKSGSLKVLVETNFDRFVAAKGTIEGVYKEMKENAFLDKDKESEYGVGKIRAYLNEAGSKADEVFGPIMTGRGREEGLRLLLSILDKHGNMLDMPNIILECVKRNDNEGLLEEYQKARKYLMDSRALVPDPSRAVATGVKEEYLHQLIVAEKMWVEVESVMEDFKKDTWKRLLECKTEDTTHMELIGILLEVGIDENPIIVWLFSRHEYLKSRISTVFERQRIDIEIIRRKAIAAPPAKSQTIAQHLRAPTRRVPIGVAKTFDTPIINSFWQIIHKSLTVMLDSKTGILGELLNFWKSAQSFIDGDNLLPAGLDDQSKIHHRLSDDDVSQLRQCAVELVSLIRDSMLSFFQDPPIEDISAFYSPLPPTPTTPSEGEFPTTPAQQAPKMVGQSDGDDYAFYPPSANSLGGVYYMSKAMILLGNAAAALAENFSGLGYGRGGLEENLRIMLGVARERMVTAVCTSWLKDATNCKAMEDWTRSSENRGVTKMPTYFLKFEKDIIGGMQSIVYLDNVRGADTSIIPPPSAKLLSSVRNQFVRSLYKALQGMVENATRPVTEDDWVRDKNGLNSPMISVTPINLTANSVHSEDKNVRMLLTLSNLQLLRSEIVPELISQFETSFSVKLTDESKTVRDALSQIDAQLFTDYTAPLVTLITSTIRNGVLDPDWSPPPGKLATEVRPYIYDALLSLVEVHAQVTTTAPSLVQQILSYLLEQLSKELLESFKQRSKFTLGELLQATLDVEFVNQTLSQFSTPKASEWQQMVYVELDRGSDAAARQGLQKELAEMKRILSTLRKYSRAEFLCFRAKKASSRRTNAHLEAQPAA